jgi:predicted amidohydrolase
MQLALAQYAVTADMQDNLGKVLNLMADARRQAAGLVLFPELCLSPFFPQYRGQSAGHYALYLEDDPIQQLQAACQRLKLAASPNVYLRERGQCFDASLMIGADGAIQGVSKMVHIAQVPGFYEQDYYTPSDTGFRVYDMPFGKVGIVVCFDRHYPESIRTCVLRGASLVLIPTANTTDEPLDLFECELRAAALQNGVYIAMCNRVGTEGEAVFAGDSMVVDPHGSVVARGNSSESLLIVGIEPSEVAVAREKRPYLALRRPDMYA